MIPPSTLDIPAEPEAIAWEWRFEEQVQAMLQSLGNVLAANVEPPSSAESLRESIRYWRWGK